MWRTVRSINFDSFPTGGILTRILGVTALLLLLLLYAKADKSMLLVACCLLSAMSRQTERGWMQYGVRRS